MRQRGEGTQRAKIEAMKAGSEDEADIKKQIEVLNDTLTVLPDARHRLQKQSWYATELRDHLAEGHQDVDVAVRSEGEQNPEVQVILEARQLLREVDQTLGTQTADEEPADDAAGTGGTADVGGAMPLQVTLASGKEVEVTAAAGDKVADLRQEIAEKLDQHPRCVELNHAGGVLADEQIVPDSQITVVLVRLPWIGADPDQVKDLGGGEFVIEGDEKKGSKCNALCEVGFSSGTEYFEVEVLEGSGAFIGVTTRNGFLEGYKIKGLFFGGPGNLSNGSGGLRTQFGEQVKAGSVIGVALDLTDESTVAVTFWEGDVCLGEAFRGCPRQPGAMVFPAVCANKVQDRFKLSLRRNPRKQTLKTPHPAIGCWDLQRLVIAGETVSLDAALAVKGKGKGRGYAVDAEAPPAMGNIIMTLTEKPGTPLFRLSLKLGNTLMTTVQTNSGPIGAEEIQLGMVAGTMVMAPPPLMDLEQSFSKALPLITSWKVTTDSLQMRGGDVEIDFRHYDAPPEEPVSSVTLP
ncbi:hypothetical protein AK812_SmicGene40301 [Symbiodinium microadriaticum]|uniref:B30.2/SPRY domain-containing protein n=1 Tax=Symbiodinium microadriaticum TaxID=2951 RepID=A0A1Q9C918_SYMMI|nr:hypothetical protein AK812_SmicGene40301 [Symbiodinium microadriaticum]